MTLGEFIKNFREENNLSQRQFSAKSGISNSLVSMLEANMNNHTGKPITPTIETIACVARACQCSIDDILNQIDSIDIDISRAESYVMSKEEAQLLAYYRSMNRAGRTVLMASAEGFASSSIYQADNVGDDAVSS